MLYRVPKFFNVNYIFIIGLWCNGSTIDFGSICLGSNPNKPAKHQNLFLIFCRVRLSVRTQDFHSCKRSSILLLDTRQSFLRTIV